MKKKSYVRPDLCYESFELAQTIATNCNVIMTAGEFDCSGNSDLLGIEKGSFWEASVCSIGVSSEVQQQYCYTPSSADKIFILANS